MRRLLLPDQIFLIEDRDLDSEIPTVAFLIRKLSCQNELGSACSML
jgi:L-serine deaminase